MALCKENTDIAYLLGRALAIVEKAEKHLNNGEAYVVERKMATAGTDIGAFYGKLHAQFVRGLDAKLSATLAEIMDKVPSDGFPSHLSLEQLSMMMAGYYHQKVV